MLPKIKESWLKIQKFPLNRRHLKQITYPNYFWEINISFRALIKTKPVFKQYIINWSRLILECDESECNLTFLGCPYQSHVL